jgi:glycosyltransferase involved in cell wall biosynthesis
MIKVGILNHYLSTFGGGEKDTYAIANCLVRAGFQVDVFTFEETVPSGAAIESFFGPRHGGFNIRRVDGRGDERARNARLREALKGYTVFINHCAGSSFPNPCPVGIYWVMFPLQAGGDFLRSYQHYVCISEFTRFYSDYHWGRHLNPTVIYPCWDEIVLQPQHRAPEIVSIGRFNWVGHKKNQDLLLGAFEDIADQLPRGWRLVLLGKVNGEAETQALFERMRERGRNLPVSFEINVSQARKRELLSRATLYWHGTGIGASEPAEAGLMEHFGIAVVEAMGAGAIPICYHRGGPREIVEHGKSGFVYRDVEELKTYTLLLAHQKALRERISAGAISGAQRFERSAFDLELNRFIQRALAMPARAVA